MTRNSTTMTIIRTFNNPVAYDAAGIPTYEKEDIDIEVEISGEYCRAEPDVGIMSSYFDDITAVGVEDKVEYELTEKEQDRACEELLDAQAGAYEDYLDSMRAYIIIQK